MSEAKRFPSLEDQRVLYDVMRDHFFDMMKEETKGASSARAMDETALFLNVFDEAGFAPAPVDVLSRAALRDATALHTVGKLTPEDFL